MIGRGQEATIIIQSVIIHLLLIVPHWAPNIQMHCISNKPEEKASNIWPARGNFSTLKIQSQ